MSYEMAGAQQALMFSSMAELVPLTQSLIPASLAQAFGIPLMEPGFGMSPAAAMLNVLAFSGSQLPQPARPAILQNPVAPCNYSGPGPSGRGADSAPQAPVQSAPSSSYATNNRASVSSQPASHTIHSQQMSFSSGRNAEADRNSNLSGSFVSPSSTMSGPPVYPPAQSLPYHHPYAHSMLAQQGAPGYAPGAPSPYFPQAAAQNPLMSYYGRDPSAYPMAPPVPGYNPNAAPYQGQMYDYSALPGAYRPAPAQPQQFSNPENNPDDEYNDDGTRAVKRPRLVWTPQLHKKFEVALNKLGPDKAVPKNIMQEMNIDGLTRENVASHLQKYRMLRKKGDEGSNGSDSDGRSDSKTTGGATEGGLKEVVAAAMTGDLPAAQGASGDRAATPVPQIAADAA